MHDNSVMSLNNAARKLLGEQNPESATDSKLKPTIPELPGDSVRCRAYRARRVCLGGSYAFDSGRTACRNPALCHFHRFHAPSGSIHVHLTGHDPGSWHYGPQSGLFADRRICFAICRRITAIACHGTRAGL